MRTVIWIIAVFVLLALQAGILGNLHFLPAVPGLLVIFCAVAMAREAWPDTAIVVAVSGIMLDFVSGLPDGILLIALGLASGFGYVLLHWWLARDYNNWILLVAAGAVTIVNFLATLGVAKLFSLAGLGGGLDYGYLLGHELVWAVVLNLLLAFPVYLYYVGTRKIINQFARNQ
jgi:hypothetical protein